MRATSVPQTVFTVVVFVALAGYAFVGGSFGLDLITKIMIYAIFALSLELIAGGVGLVSFGHAAYFGIGAYAAVLLTPKDGAASLVLLLPAAVCAAALYALAVGALSLRTRGVYFIMVTLAFAQMVFFLFLALKAYGGDDGLTFRRRNILFDFNMRDDATFFYVTLGFLLVWLAICARVLHSRFGLLLGGIRQNERRMQAVGMSVFRFRLAAFALSGAICALAGALLIVIQPVEPSVGREYIGRVFAICVLGGLQSLPGTVIAAILLGIVESITATFYGPSWAPAVAFGFLLLTLAFRPAGLLGR